MQSSLPSKCARNALALRLVCGFSQTHAILLTTDLLWKRELRLVSVVSLQKPCNPPYHSNAGNTLDLRLVCGFSQTHAILLTIDMRWKRA